MIRLLFYPQENSDISHKKDFSNNSLIGYDLLREKKLCALIAVNLSLCYNGKAPYDLPTIFKIQKNFHPWGPIRLV